jgi:hypothetical protein
MDRRERVGLARAVLIFFTGLAAAGLLIGVLNGPFDNMAATSANLTRTSQAAQGRQWVVSFWDALPFVVVFLAFFQLVAAAAAERRLPGQ